MGALVCASGLVASAMQASAEMRPLPAPLVYLHDIDATIAQDMRYAGPDNFTGRPLPGYAAPECVLHRTVAQALARVQKELVPQGLSLMVYDCYRPERAVRAFEAWATDGRADPATGRFHPRLPKSQLFALGYIAARSGHSRGTAVDLTIVRLPLAAVEPFEAGRIYGSCAGPKDKRAPDRSLDMGTGFDCFDAESHTAARAITREQREARQTLIAAMARQGLRNYAREWWHFSLEAGDGRSFDVPIAPRPGAQLDTKK
jgi:zinc D-Ala-D-Ala dipeptidase